jgi:hypothetical protein
MAAKRARQPAETEALESIVHEWMSPTPARPDGVSPVDAAAEVPPAWEITPGTPIGLDYEEPPRRRRRRRVRSWRRSAPKSSLPVLVATALVLMESKGKKTTDVLWVGTHDGEFAGTWDDFKSMSIMRGDLVICGDGWWLVREPASYRSGGKRWRYIEPPICLTTAKPLRECWRKKRCNE